MKGELLKQKRVSRQHVVVTIFVLAVCIVFAGVQALPAASAGPAVGVAQDAAPLDVTEEMTATLYLPTIYRTPPVPSLTATRPNSNNHWTLNWAIENAVGITGYEIEESQVADFSSGVQTYQVGPINSYLINNKVASPHNQYFYRVRAVVGDLKGPWSQPIEVIGAYRDDFGDNSTGWTARRMSFLEETRVYYGSGAESGYLIAIVADRWDWVVGSPLKKAPQVPYAIEFRMRIHDPANLLSGGAVFGGDWNGQACPHIGNVYQTDHCFNQFYNFNLIYYGPIKLLHEKVDQLIWCPSCGGSPLKRFGPTIDVGQLLPNPANGWNNYRIEVRADGARFYVNGNFVRHFTDTSYINRPYFGVFASTDEYKPSIFFYDWYEVKPLD